MSTIVVGYVPNALGDAALAAAIDEAGRRAAKLLVVNATRADRLVDPGYADAADVARLEAVLTGAESASASGTEFRTGCLPRRCWTPPKSPMRS